MNEIEEVLLAGFGFVAVAFVLVKLDDRSKRKRATYRTPIRPVKRGVVSEEQKVKDEEHWKRDWREHRGEVVKRR